MPFGRSDSLSSTFRGNYNFTDRSRRTLALAREEALRLQHEYVGTEHILLGLVREGEGVAATVLKSLGIEPASVPEAVERSIRPGTRPIEPTKGELPYTSRGKKVLEFAMREARDLHHSYVGTEHLLLGLLREEKGIAAEVLNELGVSLAAARDETRRVLGGSSSPPTGRTEPAFGVRIDDASSASIYEQIVAQVREAVATGLLAPGDRLPPVRRLADELDIAPGTVARAYGELEQLGVVVTEGARGTRVAERPSQPTREGKRPETLVGLLRPVAVAAFHLGATADDLRRALEEAMRDIFGGESTAA